MFKDFLKAYRLKNLNDKFRLPYGTLQIGERFGGKSEPLQGYSTSFQMLTSNMEKFL